ncbi:MAG: hypothetical protein IH597_14885 [Bacteroidales bacterium]|nr:hypothetical protein [Bacteroidales bacterium]
MKNLSINGQHICELPENWNELSAEQLLKVCALVPTSFKPENLLIQLLMLFTGLKFPSRRHPVMVDEIPHYYLKQHEVKIALISVEDIGFAASPLQFIFTEHKGEVIIESKLFQNKLPVIKAGSKELHGPDHALFNISFAEFIKLESLYDKYSKKQDDESFDEIVAVLYRERDLENDPTSPKFTGDIRVPFNDHLLDARKMIVKQIKPEYKLAVRLFYEGCRWFIFKGSNLFPNAFSGDGSEDEGMPPIHEFTRLVNALSNDDASRMELIRQTRAWDIFYQLEALATRNKELKNRNHV